MQDSPASTSEQIASIRATTDELRQRMIFDCARDVARDHSVELTTFSVGIWLMGVRDMDATTATEIAKHVAGHAIHMRRDGPDPRQQIGDALMRMAENGFEDEGDME